MNSRELAASRRYIFFNFKNAETWPRRQMEFGKFERIFNTPPPKDAHDFVFMNNELIENNSYLRKVMFFMFRLSIVRRLCGVRGVSYDGTGYEKRGDDYYQTWVKR
jgi:hypothetical protein